MEYRFNLTAANRKALINFKDLEAQYHFFTNAANNCNLGITFKRAGKKITINNITSSNIELTLSSTTTLPSPTRTLSAYSRELIRLNREIKSDNRETSPLDSAIYNHTLFHTELLENIQDDNISAKDISKPELLKAIIDLLYSPSDCYNTTQKTKAISSLKEIMLPFIK